MNKKEFTKLRDAYRGPLLYLYYQPCLDTIERVVDINDDTVFFYSGTHVHRNEVSLSDFTVTTPAFPEK